MVQEDLTGGHLPSFEGLRDQVSSLRNLVNLELTLNVCHSWLEPSGSIFCYGWMEKEIRKSIEEEAQKHAERYGNYHNNLQLDFLRNVQRAQPCPQKRVLTPIYWKEDKKFNPFYVLKHLDPISHSISTKLLSGNYKPHPPFIHHIPKRGGGKRKISVFQIPDAAVSNYFYHRLQEKNRHRFSSFSYAYRNDRNVHFAIQDISLELRSFGRMFIAEFDFSDFFGSIPHSFILEQLGLNGFLVSEFEKQIIRTFIHNDEGIGIPQGTSISLFLANLTCWSLDRHLEREGVRFARYADDTVLWSENYSKICRAFELIESFSKTAQVHINLKKSGGIRLITRKGMASEFENKTNHFEFLGYQISLENVSIKDGVVDKIKKQISYLLYRNLIQPLQPPLSPLTFPSNGQDQALITAISQIRRYLYGNLTERKISLFMRGDYKRIRFKGIMSFYPLVDDEAQLKKLDSWLLNSVLHSIKKREKLINQLQFPTGPQFPWTLTRRNLIKECFEHRYKGVKGLAAIPSFMRIYRVLKRGVIEHGITATMNSKSSKYHNSSM